MKRPLFVARIVGSFLLATFFFLLIYAAAYSASYWNYQRLSGSTNEISNSVDELDRILSAFECNQSVLSSSSELFHRAVSQLNLLEERFGKQDPRVLEQKKIYSELEYRHFLIAQKFNEQCGFDMSAFLFFYSNVGSLEDESDRMGFILTAFQRRNPQEVLTYSFDRDLDYPLIQNLVSGYSVDRAPIIVAPNGTLLYVHSLDDLDPYIREP